LRISPHLTAHKHGLLARHLIFLTEAFQVFGPCPLPTSRRLTNLEDAGQAKSTITSTTPGTAHIRAWIDDGNNSYDEGEFTDDPSTKTWTSPGPTHLQVRNLSRALWERTYRWNITNSVEPESLELGPGESDDLTYTIRVFRSPARDSYTVQFTIYAQNDGENTALISGVKGVIEYKLPGSDNWQEQNRANVPHEGSIASGETEKWDHSLSLIPVPGAIYRNVAYVTLANYQEGEYTYTCTKPFDLPPSPTSGKNEWATVTLADIQNTLHGFSASYDCPDVEMRTSEPQTYTLHTTVTHETAGPGSHNLHNTASLVEEDTGKSKRARASITIIAPEPEPDELTLEQEDRLDRGVSGGPAGGGESRQRAHRRAEGRGVAI